MLLEQTIEKLAAMKLHGMVSALQQWKQGGMKDLDATDLIGILADAECTARENRRLTRSLQEAHFPMDATVEQIDYQDLAPGPKSGPESGLERRPLDGVRTAGAQR